MKTLKTLVMTLGVAALMASCDSAKNESPVGSWTSAAPETATEAVSGASTASKSTTITFTAPAEGQTAGEVVLTTDYDVTTVAADTTEAVSYKATATIKGTYTQKDGDKDEYLMTFDKNTLQVAGVDAPELGPVTDDFLASVAKLTQIDDVEVSKDGTHMTFEVKNPKVEYHFVKK